MPERRRADGSGAPRILLAGASGLVGGALRQDLGARGWEPRRLVRRPPREPGEIAWSPADGELPAEALAGVDAVIHLGGAGIADARWTRARKALLRASRVDSTRLLAEAMAGSEDPPPVLLCASAVGIYGDRSGECVDESAAPGSGFLAELGRDWEAACEPALAAGIRVVNLRIGLVLSPAGGALARMLPLWRLGLGGPLGGGGQAFPWIALPDLIAAIRFCLVQPSLAGPVNLVAPASDTQSDFARALGRVLRRPALLPVPAFALRLLLGELAGTLLGGVHVKPARLAEAGFAWRQPELEGALRSLLGR